MFKKLNSYKKLAIVLAVVTAIWWCVAFWAWALFGMSKEVGTAHAVSGGFLLIGSFFSALAGME